MNLINKKFISNKFYILCEIYSCFIVFNFLDFNNIFYIDIKLHFIKNNINIFFIKNSLLFNLLPLKVFYIIFKSLFFFFSFNFFYLLKVYCDLNLCKNSFIIIFGYLNNKYYNRFLVYYIYFFIKNNIFFYFIMYFKKIFLKVSFLLKFILELNLKKSLNININMNNKNILNLIENLTILELNDLIKSFEEKYNINICLDNPVKNKEMIKKESTCSLYLSSVGVNKISVIKLVREINNLGLKESKDLVDSAPILLKDNIDVIVAEELKVRFEKLGSLVEIK